MSPERGLVWLLRALSAMMLLAFLAAVQPLSWMATTHEWLGLGTMPSGPIVEYSNRSLSLMYGLHGAVLGLLSRDVRRFASIIAAIGLLHAVLGIAMLAVDLSAGMPWWWTLGEGPMVVPVGLLIWWLANKVEA